MMIERRTKKVVREGCCRAVESSVDALIEMQIRAVTRPIASQSRGGERGIEAGLLHGYTGFHGANYTCDDQHTAITL